MQPETRRIGVARTRCLLQPEQDSPEPWHEFDRQPRSIVALVQRPQTLVPYPHDLLYRVAPRAASKRLSFAFGFGFHRKKIPDYERHSPIRPLVDSVQRDRESACGVYLHRQISDHGVTECSPHGLGPEGISRIRYLGVADFRSKEHATDFLQSVEKIVLPLIRTTAASSARRIEGAAGAQIVAAQKWPVANAVEEISLSRLKRH